VPATYVWVDGRKWPRAPAFLRIAKPRLVNKRVEPCVQGVRRTVKGGPDAPLDSPNKASVVYATNRKQLSRHFCSALSALRGCELASGGDQGAAAPPERTSSSVACSETSEPHRRMTWTFVQRQVQCPRAWAWREPRTRLPESCARDSSVNKHARRTSKEQLAPT
jgi:hypothetical protein